MLVEPQAQPIVLPRTGRGYFVEVAGESHYQGALNAAQATADDDGVIRVLLIPEPKNTFDAHAVAVTTSGGETLGYLTRDDAPKYQQTLLELRRRGHIGTCAGRISGGTASKPSLGLWLDIEAATSVARSLGVKYQRVKR